MRAAIYLYAVHNKHKICQHRRSHKHYRRRYQSSQLYYLLSSLARALFLLGQLSFAPCVRALGLAHGALRFILGFWFFLVLFRFKKRLIRKRVGVLFLLRICVIFAVRLFFLGFRLGSIFRFFGIYIVCVVRCARFFAAVFVFGGFFGRYLLFFVFFRFRLLRPFEGSQIKPVAFFGRLFAPWLVPFALHSISFPFVLFVRPVH